MRFVRLFLSAIFVFSLARGVFAQSMTSISPNFGGAGSSGGSVTVTGTGFSMVQKATRFVDAANVDVLTGVFCSLTTSCSASTRPGLVPAGQVQTLQVYALVNGVKSASFSNFIYYGPPVINSINPTNTPQASMSGADPSGTISGGAFTSGGSFPGTTSVYFYLYIHDYTSGCTSTAQCGFVAESPVTHDCCQGQGAYSLRVDTPGGTAQTNYLFGTTPTTPSITSISPNTGTRLGGNTVTITGTGFKQTATAITSFTFSTFGSFGTSTTVTGSCSSDTSCTATVPAGGSGGPADVSVVTTCPASTVCAGTRASGSITSTKKSAYTYASLVINPPQFTTLYTSENGASAQFTVALSSQPAAAVHVALSTTGGRGTLSTSGLDFTTGNWNTPQTVTVTGLDDTGAGGAAAPGTGNFGYSVSSVATSTDPNYNTLNGSDVQLVNLDNDTAQYYVAPNSGLVTTEFGGTATFTVVLTKAPTSTVTMTLVSNDPSEGSVSPASLTFATTTGGATGWNVPRTVTVTGLPDGIVDGDIFYSIIITASTADAAYSSIQPNDVFLTNKDSAGLPAPTVAGDFNGDGKPDILLRNYATGQDAVWLMNGTALSTIVDLPALANLNYHFEGTADFNGDGKPDILLRNYSTGQNAVWLMNGTTVSSVVDLPALPNTAYHFDGTGDFNGDGKPDIILRNYSTGQNAVWLMNGTTLASIVDLPALPSTAFQFESCGDFNGDGKPDIVIRNYSTGQDALWLMNGTSLSSIVDLPALPNVNYYFSGVADFNGDGKPDIVLRNYTTGQDAVWLMNGTALSSIVDLPALLNTSFEFDGPR